tara:strand:+ start:1226 stop:1360 length:135 start_codon:yes stop_codon:yes gene_type:complete
MIKLSKNQKAAAWFIFLWFAGVITFGISGYLLKFIFKIIFSVNI